MKNIIERDRNNWIVSELTKLRSEMNELKYNQPLTIERFDAGSFGAYTIADNNFSSQALTLTSTDGKTLFAIPEITFYKTSVTAANIYPYGANWTTAQVLGFSFEVDYDEVQTDGDNLKLVVTMKNETGGGLDVFFTFSVRYVKGTA